MKDKIANKIKAEIKKTLCWDSTLKMKVTNNIYYKNTIQIDIHISTKCIYQEDMVALCKNKNLLGITSTNNGFKIEYCFRLKVE